MIVDDEVERPSALMVMFAQIAVTTRQVPAKRFNPRPPGVIQKGSATDAVLAFLLEHPGLKTEAQIVLETKRTHSAVSWSLLRLRSWGKIDAVSDPSRNARYMRYRAKP